MLNDLELLSKLKSLEKELQSMITQRNYNKLLTSWYPEALEHLKKVFGPNSEEVKEFLLLKPEIPSNLIERAKEITDKITQRRPDIKMAEEEYTTMEDPTEHFYRERSYQLNELLLLAITELKNRLKNK